MRRDAARAIVSACFAAGLVAACGSSRPAPSNAAAAVATNVASSGNDVSGHDETAHATLAPADRAAAQLGTAVFQDVGQAEAAGYASTLDTLGCFQSAQQGGMGVHYLSEALMDDKLDIAHPEALVYELDARRNIAGLVAHEYIVPTAAWTRANPPTLLGIPLHRHPSLPLWVLHIWLWKDNPAGILTDWNPAVRPCPAGVPVFGVDRPLAPDATTTTTVAPRPSSTDDDRPQDRRGPR